VAYIDIETETERRNNEMGAVLSCCVGDQSSTPRHQQDGTAAGAPTGNNDPPSAVTTSTSGDNPRHYFDAAHKSDAYQYRTVLESVRANFRGSVYYDALANMEQQELEEDNVGGEGVVASSLGSNSTNSSWTKYAPADRVGPSRRTRASMKFDENDGRALLCEVAERIEEGEDEDGAAASDVDFRASVEDVMTILSSHREVDAQGYPGNLTEEELRVCREFRNMLKSEDPYRNDSAYVEMVLQPLQPAEDEPYAICRFLRARNFDIPRVLEMIAGEPLGSSPGGTLPLETWKKARDNGTSKSGEPFYPTCRDAVGYDDGVFYTQFPCVHSGLAKNGTIASYVRVGSVTVAGIRCLVGANTHMLANYYWYHVKVRLVNRVVREQAAHPEMFVRCEETYIIDLKHLQLSQVDSTFIDTMKVMFAPTDCFPELLNKVVILNAPGFFSFIWRIVKLFLHPRTAQKVEIYSNEKAGMKRLRELLDDDKDIPKDYGGDNPLTYHEIAEREYCNKNAEDSKDARRIKQVHQLMSAYDKSQRCFEFTVPERQCTEITSITVYTNSNNNATFSLSSTTPSNNNNSDGGVTVAPPSGHAAGHPYSQVLWKDISTANSSAATDYRIELSCEHKEDHFLVIVEMS